MKAIIYKPAKNPEQSGGAKNYFLLEFIQDPASKFEDKITGGVSSVDTINQIKIKFTSEKCAVDFAKRNNYDYEIIEPRERKIPKKSYSENFR